MTQDNSSIVLSLDTATDADNVTTIAPDVVRGPHFCKWILYDKVGRWVLYIWKQSLVWRKCPSNSRVVFEYGTGQSSFQMSSFSFSCFTASNRLAKDFEPPHRPFSLPFTSSWWSTLRCPYCVVQSLCPLMPLPLRAKTLIRCFGSSCASFCSLPKSRC